VKSKAGLAGVVVPAHADGRFARETVTSLLEAVEVAGRAAVVILVDNGDNDGFDGGLPSDSRLLVVETSKQGPGYARTAGAKALGAYAAARNVSADETWLVSLDADVSIEADFLLSWLELIEAAEAEILVAPALFAALGGEAALATDVASASEWMWKDTALWERFVGVVNVGGCNHAVSLATCSALSYYLQPTEQLAGQSVLVAGDDWDFGLRARLLGKSIARVNAPLVRTSSRRIALNPTDFLAGHAYEHGFEPVRDVSAGPTWPPEERWSAIAKRGRARLVAHFLLKPLLAGVPVDGALSWFLGTELADGLDQLVSRLARWTPEVEWNEYRGELLRFIFSEDVFGWCSAAAQQVSGG